MANILFKITFAAALLVVSGCQNRQEIRPAIVPGVEVRMPESKISKPKPQPVKRQLWNRFIFCR